MQKIQISMFKGFIFLSGAKKHYFMKLGVNLPSYAPNTLYLLLKVLGGPFSNLRVKKVLILNQKFPI